MHLQAPSRPSLSPWTINCCNHCTLYTLSISLHKREKHPPLVHRLFVLHNSPLFPSMYIILQCTVTYKMLDTALFSLHIWRFFVHICCIYTHTMFFFVCTYTYLFKYMFSCFDHSFSQAETWTKIELTQVSSYGRALAVTV